MEPLFVSQESGSTDTRSFLLNVLVALLLLPTIVVCLFLYKMHVKPTRRNTVTILVIGDIGRSPRMMYHAESFAKRGWETILIGYDDTPPIPSLTSLPHVHIHPIASPPPPFSSLPWIARAPLRIIFQIMSILYISWFAVPVHTELLLVQNPPSIPTLALAQLIAKVSGSRVLVDWHNEGHSILAMRVGKGSSLVRIAKWFERTFGRVAFVHLFVTRALQSHLTESWHLKGKSTVLYDRPPSNFRSTDTMSLHELFHRLEPSFAPPIPEGFQPETSDETILSKPGVRGMPMLREDRPALVVSSTSWTADEDFGMLLTALDRYAAAKQKNPKGGLPKLLVIITGKGGLRKPFEAQVAKSEATQWSGDIIVRCVFLEARDYPVLLGCADVGVSLHTSSSGRDLPMKVVDMFGCGVPVLAKGFECVSELVQEGKNGLIFENGEELGKQLADVLDGFPKKAKKLESLKSFFTPSDRPSRPSSRSGVPDAEREKEWCTWDENWERVVYNGILGRTGGGR